MSCNKTRDERGKQLTIHRSAQHPVEFGSAIAIQIYVGLTTTLYETTCQGHLKMPEILGALSEWNLSLLLRAPSLVCPACYK